MAEIGDGYITMGTGWTIGCDRPERFAVGDVVELWGRGTGYPVRGLAVDRTVVWYRTEAEQEAHEQGEIDRNQQERRRRFEENRAELDAQYDALPTEFQARLDRFRAGHPDFRWEHEAYEMSVCVDAVKIAEWCKVNRSAPDQSWLAAVREFHSLPWERQQEAGVSDGHSGNSFGATCRLAQLWVLCPPEVVREHGALTPLVGCEAYGCTHEAQP